MIFKSFYFYTLKIEIGIFISILQSFFGNWINEKGVTPTKEVKLELKENETLTEDNDNQLKAAIELASK